MPVPVHKYHEKARIAFQPITLTEDQEGLLSDSGGFRDSHALQMKYRIYPKKRDIDGA
jgi:hypothetical protein